MQAGTNKVRARARNRWTAWLLAAGLALGMAPQAWAGRCVDCEPPPLPADDAAFVAQSVPTSMVAGQTYAVSVQLQNTGSSTWSTATGYQLGSQNPQDTMTWGLNRVSVAGSIAGGQTGTFSFTVTAPATPGSYNFQWKMLAAGTWFGAATANVVVTVSAATGSLTAAPNPCTIPAGGSQCSATLSWSSNAADAQVWVSPLAGGAAQLFAQAQSGSQAAPWITAAGSRFQLKTGATVLASVDVRGVAPNAAPTVALTSPTNGQSFTSGSSVSLAANAADSDGSIARVEFLVDGAKVAEDTTAPYAVSWTATAGSHAITAKAIDNLGASATSGSASISVATVPAPPVNATLTRIFVYDANQQLCKTIEPETGATVMHYDAAGNLDWSAAGLPLTGSANYASPNSCDIDAAYASGRRVDRTYDQRNRPKSLIFPDHNGDQTWDYTPDGLPRQVTTSNNSNLVTNLYSYNRRRLLTSESMTQGANPAWTLTYGYTPNGHLGAIQQPGGEWIDYAPNALGQATRVTGTYGTYASGVSYHPNGAIAQFTYGNGIVHTLAQNARQLPDRSRDAYGATAVLDDSYTYDYNANVAAISDGLPGNRGNRTMSYDGLDRLTGTVSPMFGSAGASYRYDVLDNLIEVKAPGQSNRQHTYWYEPGSNRLTTVQNQLGNAVVGLAYDAQGNLANKNGTTFSFDFGNRLRQVRYAGGEVESYRYDAYGRRVFATTPNTAGQVIFSQYDQAGVLRYQQDNRRGAFLNYVYLGGSLVAIRESNASSGAEIITYQHTDALGSPVAVTDANRAVVQRSEYEPYGYLLNRAPTDGPGFTGHVLDAQTGMNYMQQRYYDPLIGRFLSVDPVTVTSVGGNFNRYWYANDNPYRFVDPDGRQPKSFDRDEGDGPCSGADCTGGSEELPEAPKVPENNGLPYIDSITVVSQPDPSPSSAPTTDCSWICDFFALPPPSEDPFNSIRGHDGRMVLAVVVISGGGGVTVAVVPEIATLARTQAVKCLLTGTLACNAVDPKDIQSWSQFERGAEGQVAEDIAAQRATQLTRPPTARTGSP